MLRKAAALFGCLFALVLGRPAWAADGSLLWAKMPWSGGDLRPKMAVAEDGSIFLAGSFDGTWTLGQTTLASAGYGDIYLVKLHPDGSLAWARQAGGALDDAVSRICCLPDGTCYVAGTFSTPRVVPLGSTAQSVQLSGRQAVFGAGEPNQAILDVPTSSADDAVYLAKYQPDGSLAWARRETDTSITFDWIDHRKDGSVVVMGWYMAPLTLDRGGPNETKLSQVSGQNIFIASYSPEGKLIWAKRMGNEDPSNFSKAQGSAVRTLPDGSCLVAGFFAGPITFGAGEPNQMTIADNKQANFFLAKFQADGSFAWVRLGQGTPDIYGMSVGEDGSCYLAGHFYGSITLGQHEPGETTFTAQGTGNFDLLLARFQPDGALAWARQVASPHQERASGVTALKGGGCLVTGYVEGPVTFGAGEPNETTSPNNTSTCFLARYSDQGRLDWIRLGDIISGYARGREIEALDDGSSVVSGELAETVRFGPGELRETTLGAPAGIINLFIARYAGPNNAAGRWTCYE